MGDLYNQEHDITAADARRGATLGTENSLLRLAVLVTRLQETGSWDAGMLHTDIDYILEQEEGRIDPSVKQKPPASNEALSNLPRLQLPALPNGTRPTCPICTEDINPSDTATRLPCNHVFHLDCVLPWLRRHCTCPMCREELPTDNVEYEQEKRVAKRRAGVAAMRNQMFN
eukprot:GFKZ01005947.1.p2 GENE.GFKZ01005947.1~~GFKZ01005947.1.p2  ORF type:complete len:172 (-),score=14.52 GFKZ01005947.1:606-1121(-)